MADVTAVVRDVGRGQHRMLERGGLRWQQQFDVVQAIVMGIARVAA